MHFVKTTLVGGLLIALPVVVIIALLRRGAAIVHPLIEPVVSRLPAGVPFPGTIALTIEMLAVVLGCFVLGLLVQTSIGRKLVHVIEARLFENVPGYRFVRSVMGRAAGHDEGPNYKVALVEIEGGLVPAFVIELHADGRYTVFVPSAPMPTSGTIYIFPRELVHIVDIPITRAFRCLTRLGAGAGHLLEAMRRS